MMLYAIRGVAPLNILWDRRTTWHNTRRVIKHFPNRFRQSCFIYTEQELDVIFPKPWRMSSVILIKPRIRLSAFIRCK